MSSEEGSRGEAGEEAVDMIVDGAEVEAVEHVLRVAGHREAGLVVAALGKRRSIRNNFYSCTKFWFFEISDYCIELFFDFRKIHLLAV